MSDKKITEFFQQIPLFQDLTIQELDRLEEITISRSVSRKSVIFSEGVEKEAVFFIMEGLVKTYKTDENGHEQIISFLKAGDMFPHTGLFNKKPYPATAEAIIDCKLFAIPVRLFEHLMTETPSIAIKMMHVMGDIIRELQEKLQVLTGQDVKYRALSFLLKLADQHGQMKDQQITINLPMTHQEFANSVGTTRETINRLLNQLTKENILVVDRRRIVIKDINRIKELLENK
ncbi:Crp/Fnr family transcriptional regulator [Bacillus sp. FJAT-50079]|uniref:Crp/Fnr family transcriptional regulator n=1 Tax=Bacillus sp. FJAT-50079 TaxID=2833577 RepID=UPI001BC92137|nr:Crp/Fnr family transcriptional regulator [Bacillus sp. FJAT-50079]MBS4209414.1 Crp/Fnr family transcriptional regulator [Bacillus sp. FJAT-50079]